MPKERTIIPVVDVFSSRTLEKANHDLDSIPTKENFTGGNKNIFRVTTKVDDAPYAFYYQGVSFDQHACVTEWKDFRKIHLGGLHTTESVADMTQEGVEKMAQILGWENKTIRMASSILSYKLISSHPAVTNMPWHQDGGGNQNITMTTVYTRSYQENVTYTGGELGFRHTDYYKTSSILGNGSNYLHFDRDSYMQLTESQKQGRQFPYQENCGYIFDNTSSEHRVHDMSLHNPNKCTNAVVERRLFSIFTSLTDDQYRETISLCDSHNLLSDEEAKVLRADRGEVAPRPSVLLNTSSFFPRGDRLEARLIEDQVSSSRRCVIS